MPGSRHAEGLDGLTPGESPPEPQALTILLAEAGADLVTLSVRTWQREDVRPIVEHIVGSLEITPT
ncbi:MAG TPA: hypothetical protein VES67_26680 [Vicinamibacterales bacterium]|nr:hypothetical protein [Vicinamibacterales bacterium]